MLELDIALTLELELATVLETELELDSIVSTASGSGTGSGSDTGSGSGSGTGSGTGADTEEDEVLAVGSGLLASVSDSPTQAVNKRLLRLKINKVSRTICSLVWLSIPTAIGLWVDSLRRLRKARSIQSIQDGANQAGCRTCDCSASHCVQMIALSVEYFIHCYSIKM